ncbi:hypothetical protein TNCV_207561 [Trichonephila clavipes]|nr:hypothetical protein TNCV_207561 [Trichonephila clavipes]
MMTSCFFTSDNLRQKAVFHFIITLQMTQRQRYWSIVLFGGQLVGNPLRTNFSKVQVLMHYDVSGPHANTQQPMDLVHGDSEVAQDLSIHFHNHFRCDDTMSLSRSSIVFQKLTSLKEYFTLFHKT